MKRNYNFEFETKGKSELKTVKTVVKSFLNLLPAQAKEKLQECAMPEIWRRVMGETVAKRTTEIKLWNKVLFIKIESACLKNDLVEQRDEILRKIKANTTEEINSIFWK